MYELYWRKNSSIGLWQCFPAWIRPEIHNRAKQTILGVFYTVSVAEGKGENCSLSLLPQWVPGEYCGDWPCWKRVYASFMGISTCILHIGEGKSRNYQGLIQLQIESIAETLLTAVTIFFVYTHIIYVHTLIYIKHTNMQMCIHRPRCCLCYQ